MYELIKELCASKGISPTKLCTEITGSKGNLPTWQKGNINPTSLIKIADFFNVSVDYLLGRTENSQTTKSSENENTNISDNPETIELIEMIRNLSLVERSKVILFIDELKNKKQQTASPVIQDNPPREIPPQQPVSTEQPRPWKMAARSTDGRYVTRYLTPEEVENLKSLDEEPEY